MNGNEMSIMQIMLEAGLVVKLVLLILIIFSVTSWAIFLKKREQLKIMNARNNAFLEMYRKQGNLDEVLNQSTRYQESSYQMMFSEAYNEYKNIQGVTKDTKSYFSSIGFTGIERSLQVGASKGRFILDKNISTLASIASISPFIGLLGTVWGIINSFTGIAGGGSSIDSVAPGIAEALVATAIGLFAAIPAVGFYNHFSHKNAEAIQKMENFGQEFLNTLERAICK